MYKRLLCLMILICCLLSLTPEASAAESTDVRDAKLITSHCPYNHMELTIQGDKLLISGVLSTGFDSAFWAMMYLGDEEANVSIVPGESFSTSLSLRAVTEPTPFKVFTGGTEYGVYRSLILRSIYIGPDDSGGYRFCESPVLENNIQKAKGWINPADCLGSDIPAEIKSLSNEITKDAQSDYEKVFRLYQWVTRNICYDYDIINGLAARDVSAADVLSTRRSVCQGYANLLQALIQSQNIPCIIVSAFCLDTATDGRWTDKYINAADANHAHNEAFVGGRWIIMDATWDSNNKYENGVYYYEDPNCCIYFDITQEVFSGDHKTIVRPEASEENTPSTWARAEIMAAIRAGLVPAELQRGYRKGITREEFCKLIMDMLCKKSDMNLDEYLKSKKIEPDKAAFTDTSSKHVLAAGSLGIVEGRGNNLFDPNSYITRQEAAKILANAARFMGKLPDKPYTHLFSDRDQFASWAVPHIDFITALSVVSGGSVMDGIENNRFSPLAAYTREQSLITVYRLYI